VWSLGEFFLQNIFTLEDRSAYIIRTGIMLFEFLVGNTPYKSSDKEEIVKNFDLPPNPDEVQRNGT